MRLLAVFLLATSPVVHAGEVRHSQKTDPELASMGIGFEKAEFTFDEPVTAEFWIESQTGGSPAKRHAVSREGVAPAKQLVLSYVISSDEHIRVSAATDVADPIAPRRSFSLGGEMKGGSRECLFVPQQKTVPLDKEITVFEILYKPGFRRPEEPIRYYRIIARFKKA